MNSLLDSIFSLDAMGFSNPDTTFTWARPVPLWGWVLIFAAIVTLVSLSYMRQRSAPRVRLALAAVRVTLATLLLVLASGPQLQRDNERIEEDWLIVMLDRSRSMQIPDAPGPSGRITRDRQMQDALTHSADTLQTIAREKQILWLGFDSSAFETEPPTNDAANPLAEPLGRSTAIGASLESALQRVAARPVSGILLLSDGQSVDQPARSLLRSLESQLIPVFTVPLGNPEPIADFAVRTVRAPEVVFADDLVTAEVEVERRGSNAGDATVELIDLDTQATLDQAKLDFDQDGLARGALSISIDQPGVRRLGVRVVTRADDLIDENNNAELTVDVVDRPLRTLYIDGYPRWEQRYVKSLLMRERSIRSSSLLLAANRRYLQEGDVELVQIPRSVEEWAEYDVVILGDLRPQLLGEEALAQLREHVAERGAGLIWIAGPGATPHAWRNSPLADLLPMVIDSDRPLPVFAEPVTMSRTPQAESLGLFRLQLKGEYGAETAGWPAFLSDPATGWSLLRWAQQIDPSRLKPGAQVLTTLTPMSGAGPSEPDWPGVLLMRFGAGASAYIPTDEIWRWRYGRGEDLPERFWVPLIRQLGRASLARSHAPVLLRVTPEEALVDRPVRITVELIDQALIDAQPSGVRTRIVAPDQSLIDLRLERQPDGKGRFHAGQWTPQRPGRYEIRIADPLLPGVDVSRTVRVSLPDDEMRRPETDHALLRTLSQRTGGKTLEPQNLAELRDLLPNRELTVAGEPDIQTLWDRPIVLAVLIVLLTLEWVGRRLIRLA